jgi:serine/threonine protein kinase
LVDSDNLSKIVSCYGISQDPNTKNYVMVMEYIEGGNIREYLKSNHKSIGFPCYRLYSIATGLNSIHQQGLVHRDLHAGNILNSNNEFAPHSYITDLGLSQPANSPSEAGKIYGVIPYVAPEVLLGKPYTQASDIYSFGMIMYEMFTGLPPYYDMVHDVYLALKICQGLRPKFQIKIPQDLEDLINRC